MESVQNISPFTEHVSKLFYLAFYLTGSVIFLIFLFLMLPFNLGIYEWGILSNAYIIMILLGIIIASVPFLSLFYKGWNAIQEGTTQIAPAKAVWFSLIPYFNFYWVFLSEREFAIEYNKYIDRHNLTVPYLNNTLFTLLPIFSVLYVPIVNEVLASMVINQICDGINNLVDASIAVEPETESMPKVEPTIKVNRISAPFGVLIAESGPLKGQAFKLAPGCNSVIGRAGDIALPQSDVSASREHARIRDENGKFVIYDMGSTNHTYVNGERVNRKVLLNNDKIKIGKTIFRFQWIRGK